MPKTDLLPIKTQLRQYLTARGISYNPQKKTWRCPVHGDDHESAVLYENPDGGRFYCPVCAQTWDIFQLCGILDGHHEFKDQLKSVRATLGIPEPERGRKPRKAEPLPFPDDKKAEFEDVIKSLIPKKGEIAGSWKYHDANGKTIGIDIRFQREGEKKEVLTFWYDGQRLKWVDPPVLIYNLVEVANDTTNRPILIHEGAKCADAARVLAGFISVSWSGGSGKSGLADWSVMAGHEVYIFPDDDVPGFKAARTIVAAIPGAKIIKPVEAALTLKKHGADIVEVLQVMTPDEFTAYALDPNNHMDDSDLCPVSTPPASTQRQDVPSHPPGAGHSSEPFKILGMGDDGRAAFITQEGRLVKYGLDGIGKGKLTVLASQQWWEQEFPRKGSADYDAAVDDIVRRSQVRDFNDSMVRGRGAWSDDGLICYHDGIKTYGEVSPNKIYLRLACNDIGIDDAPIDAEAAEKIKNAVMHMSFETRADALRCLGWSVIAPFCGALKFRPALLITGSSGSGKSTVAQLVIKKLTKPLWLNGSESTPAYVRQKVKNDSAVVVLDETEADTEKKRVNRNELLSLMRASTSDDAPDSGKGGADGVPISFKMKNIFAFIAIDPTVENVADENRIFRINMIKPENKKEWKKLERELQALINEKSCRAVRALTWSKLTVIFELAERVCDKIMDITDKDYRSSYGDAIMAAAFMVVWKGSDCPSDDNIENTLTAFFNFQPPEEHRNEAVELMDRLMEEVIEVLHEHSREKLSIEELLTKIYAHSQKRPEEILAHDAAETGHYVAALARCGIRVGAPGCPDTVVAIKNNHHFIQGVLGTGRGYSRILRRHPGCIDHQKNIWSASSKKPVRHIIIDGLVHTPEPEPKTKDTRTDEETLEALFE